MAHGVPSILDKALRRIEGLPQLSGFVQALGYERAWEEIPPTAWLGLSHWSRSIRRAAAVGRLGGFTWYAVEAADPASVARNIATKLAQRGEHAGVMTLDIATRRLALSVTFRPHPVLTLELFRPSELALHCLERASVGEPSSTIETAARIAKALDGAEPGRGFIHGFRLLLHEFTAELSEAVPRPDRQRMALLQLTRILFLYFVQSKGWLDGKPDFLRLAVDRHLAVGSDLHRDFFRPLFFGTLNQPPERRSRVSRDFGRVPFLNGGLFEPHPLERRYRLTIRNALWGKAFDNLFERFHFTVREGNNAHAIAPDMLGRVFEGVMDPDERKRSGTYYTPADLVRDLLEAGISAFLTTRFGLRDAETARRVRDRDPSLGLLARSMTILDPAVGSGAFLLGALEWLAAVRRKDGWGPALRREILGRNLYGVDVSAVAVTLTELRLWLAVLSEEPAHAPEAVDPLPNLDCLIRQGDSISDPFGVAHGSVPQVGSEGRFLGEVRRHLVHATGPDKAKEARLLRQIECRTMRTFLKGAEARLDHQIAECVATGKSKTLFGDRHGLDASLQSQLRALRAQRRHLRQARRKLERERELPWFHYESHFADIFAEGGGFDLVLGNPPWIRAELLPRVVRQQLSRRYRWWQSVGGSGFRHQPDLALAFLERGLELTGPDGSIAFLVPAKLATAEYARKARRNLVCETTLHSIADLTPTHAKSFDATTYPLAVVATKNRPPDSHTIRPALSATETVRVAQVGLRDGGPWVLKADPVRGALKALSDHPQIGDGLSCHLGLKTGANAVFLNPRADVEHSLRRLALRGRDIDAWSAIPKISIIWTHDSTGLSRSTLPPRAEAYFGRHAAVLRRRSDFREGPIWQLFRVGPALATFKVVWADIARRLEAVALVPATHQDMIPLNTCYLIPTRSGASAHALAAWLNSTWIRAAAGLQADPARGGFARFNARVISSLPLPHAVLADTELTRLAERATSGVAIQHSVDELAARHLGLSATAREALRGVAGIDSSDRR